ncbi:uncharacterized protein LOC135483350 [Lineus longissimus]|uniref:uncharacterized protein LOC135483350 n=1 Tax=Lineus longissimus TaxID=88925 RepID=UPI00315D7A1B
MTTKEYIVLYTHQKQKKAKVWQDGVLKYPAGGDNKKATLFDDNGNRLEQVHIKPGKVEVGDDLESARHLITVEEVKIAAKIVDEGPPPKENWFAESKRPKVPAAKPLSGKGVSSARGRGLPRTGLLRKRSASLYNDEGNRLEKAYVKSGQGFNPPRLVKKPRLEEETETPAETSPVVSSRPQNPSNLFSLYSERRPVEGGSRKRRDEGPAIDNASERSKGNQSAPSLLNLAGMTRNLGETCCNHGVALSRIGSVPRDGKDKAHQSEKRIPSFGKPGLRTSKQLAECPGPEQTSSLESMKETVVPPIPLRRNKSQILALIGSETKCDNRGVQSASDQPGRACDQIQHKSPREKMNSGSCMKEIQNCCGLDKHVSVTSVTCTEKVNERCHQMQLGAHEPGLDNDDMVPKGLHVRVDQDVPRSQTSVSCDIKSQSQAAFHSRDRDILINSSTSPLCKTECLEGCRPNVALNTSNPVNTVEECIDEPKALSEAKYMENSQHTCNIDLACAELKSESCVFQSPDVSQSSDQLELVSCHGAELVFSTDLPANENTGKGSFSSNINIGKIAVEAENIDSKPDKDEADIVENCNSSLDKPFLADLGQTLQGNDEHYSETTYSGSTTSHSLVCQKLEHLDEISLADTPKSVIGMSAHFMGQLEGDLIASGKQQSFSLDQSPTSEPLDGPSGLCFNKTKLVVNCDDTRGDREAKAEVDSLVWANRAEYMMNDDVTLRNGRTNGVQNKNHMESDSERMACSQDSTRLIQERNVQSWESQSEQWTQDTLGTGCTLGGESQSAIEDSVLEKGPGTFVPVVLPEVGDHDCVLQKRVLALRRPMEIKPMGLGSRLVSAFLPGENVSEDMCGRGDRPETRDIENRRNCFGHLEFESLPPASHTRGQSVQEGSTANANKFGMMELVEQGGLFQPLASQPSRTLRDGDDPVSQRIVHTSCRDAGQPQSESCPGVGESMRRMAGQDADIMKDHQSQRKETLYTPRWSKSGAVVRRTAETAVPVDKLPQVHEQPDLVDYVEEDPRVTEAEPSLYCLDFNSKQVVSLSDKLNFFMQKSEFNFSPNLTGYQSSASSPGQEVPLASQMSNTKDHDDQLIHHVPEEDALPFDSQTQEQAIVFTVPDVPATKERKPLKSMPFDDEQRFDTYSQSQAYSHHGGSQLKVLTHDIPGQLSPECHDQGTSAGSCDKTLQSLLENFQEDSPSIQHGVPPLENCDSPELFTQDFDSMCEAEFPQGLPEFQGVNARSQLNRVPLPVASPKFYSKISFGRNQFSEETKSDMDMDISLDSDDLNVSGFQTSQSQNMDRHCEVRSRPIYSSIPSLPPHGNNYSEKENYQNEMSWRLGKTGSHVQNCSIDSCCDVVPKLRYPNTNRIAPKKGGVNARTCDVNEYKTTEKTNHVSSKWDRYNRSGNDGAIDKPTHYHGRFSPPKQTFSWKESSSCQIENDSRDVAYNRSTLNSHLSVEQNLPNVHGTNSYSGTPENHGPYSSNKLASRIQSYQQTPTHDSSKFDKLFALKPNGNCQQSCGFAPSSGGYGTGGQNFASQQKAYSFSKARSTCTNSNFISPERAPQLVDIRTPGSFDSPEIVSPMIISDDVQDKPWIEGYRKNKEKVTVKSSPALSVFRTPVMGGFSVAPKGERSLGGELAFPSQQEVESKPTPVRQVTIQTTFPSVPVYKQVITSALREHLNITLFTVSKMYHHALERADVSKYRPSVGVSANTSSYSRFKATASSNNNPACEHGQPSKIVQVRKDGKNKGRFFFSCNAARNEQCKYFKWADELKKGAGGASQQSKVYRLELSDPHSINTYFRGQGVRFYCECQLLRKGPERHHTKGFPAWARKRRDEEEKKKFYLKLSRKEGAGSYSKDDLWIVSRDFSFEPDCTFIAKSSFYGPNSTNEVQIDPVTGFSSSKWTSGVVCHAILACNAASEFTCISTIQDHLEAKSPPIVSHLIQLESLKSLSRRMQGDCTSSRSGFSAPRVVTTPFQELEKKCYIPEHLLEEEVITFTEKYCLNVDQASALRGIADMFDSEKEGASAVQLIHGVFGAGKSYLLAVLVMFLDAVFNHSDIHTPGVPFPWKILISSTTNVAVDRILMGLLDMGYDDFVRVGSVKKIAKPVLPYSVHASGTESQELKDLQDMLRSELTPTEKHCVRKSIEQHRLGRNKKKLTSARVVGATCAACPFPCMEKMVFPVVFLDECSQITEPSSLLPIARFKCEKLVLIGDPKQLGPTLQGSEAAHLNGLEQTLFDRLLKMGYDSTLLRTQYRCHPRISTIANSLFYNNQLIDGIEPTARPPLLPDLPTSCFYNVSTGREQRGGVGSFYNETEVEFVISLIDMMLMLGVEAASIGVITLYRAQMVRLGVALQACSASYESELKSIQISTVDAFQGGEKDIIILSCVRTQAVGFIDSEQRTNVALTRAKNHLLIVGNMKNLSKNILWGKIIQHCRGYPNGVQESSTALASFKKLLQQKRSLGEEQVQSNQMGKRKQRLKKTHSQVVQTPDTSQVTQIEEHSWDDAQREVPHQSVMESPAMSLDSHDIDMILTKPNQRQWDTIIDETESPVISHDSPNSDTVPAKPKQRRRHTIDASLFDEDWINNQEEEELPEFTH